MKKITNPKLYFYIDKIFGCIVPFSGFNSDLDKTFKDDEIKKINVESYNAYTKKFSEQNRKEIDIYWSELYVWDSKTKTFNFEELNRCSEDEYTVLSKMQSEFNFFTDYFLTEKETTDISNSLLMDIKKNHPCPKISTGFYVEEPTWNFLIRNIIKHINTILIGPTGTGKTEIVQRMCNELQIPCHIYDMGSMQDPLTDLLGSHRLINGSSTFDYAKFVYDVQQPGVILLDELSRAPLMTNNILFPCLDSRRTLPIEIADSNHDRSVKVHPECTFIATANIGAEYAGTNDIDAALLNRFLPIQLDYLPPNIESNILTIRTNLNKVICDKIVAIVNKIRSEYGKGVLSKSISTRETLACAELVSDGFPLNNALLFIITNKYMNNNYNDELSTVKRLIMNF